LRVIRSKTTKKRFVGCEGYPECDQTYPLPQRGDIIGLDEVCPQCGSPKIKILGGRRPWILCLDPYCPTKDEYRKKQAARAAQSAAEAEAGGGAGTKPAAKKPAAKKSTAKTGATKSSAAKKPAARKAATTRRTAKAAAEPVGAEVAARTAATDDD